ncbi:Hypothetical Protein FCC1311_090512 [Hondaea fermentalgiana]|uniref:Uncharacterized protein n=1 Tax=Hondaea fermentalgiana TaxID=2315210 RepID=A0A2R5GPM0_9STRA|nr:Hypothetical Protein FCC1311_090512 [Hondaea fermentalgiana]|eukprot:GBG32826.1 Hypothetical Protein FCC1311_090512 [Hondaea fermentalgiana]
MALTRLDLDELLRFESQRAQDLATLLSGGDKLADQERQKCMLRERWRRQHEDLTLEKCSPEAMGRLDASVLQSLKQHVKASTGTRIEEGFEPLASSTRHRLADRANAGVLADLAASELSLAKDSLEMEALKIAERDACAQQVRAYEKRIGHHLRRAKLPPGWVLSEEETDDSASSGDTRVEDGRANRNRYLNLKSGQLVDKHPNLTKLDELKMKARRGADRALQMRLEELDALKAAIRMQHVALVEQTMRM